MKTTEPIIFYGTALTKDAEITAINLNFCVSTNLITSKPVHSKYHVLDVNKCRTYLHLAYNSQKNIIPLSSNPILTVRYLLIQT